jgi:hypothetical protein
MLSRGFQGKMPNDNDVRETQLRLAFVLPGIALGLSIATGLLI